jgi:hypothetical protein
VSDPRREVEGRPVLLPDRKPRIRRRPHDASISAICLLSSAMLLRSLPLFIIQIPLAQCSLAS